MVDLKAMSTPELHQLRMAVVNELHLRITGDTMGEVVSEIRPRSSLTTDRNDPRLGYGVDDEPVPQSKAYLVLSEEERAKGFVKPVRRSYRHVGIAGPKFPLRDLTQHEKDMFAHAGYIKYEEYPQGGSVKGRLWSQVQLDNVGKGCGTVTTMGVAIAETYARQPSFYGSTYCCGCGKHRPVGEDGEFVWEGTDERVGT